MLFRSDGLVVADAGEELLVQVARVALGQVDAVHDAGGDDRQLVLALLLGHLEDVQLRVADPRTPQPRLPPVDLHLEGVRHPALLLVQFPQRQQGQCRWPHEVLREGRDVLLAPPLLLHDGHEFHEEALLGRAQRVHQVFEEAFIWGLDEEGKWSEFVYISCV